MSAEGFKNANGNWIEGTKLWSEHGYMIVDSTLSSTNGKTLYIVRPEGGRHAMVMRDDELHYRKPKGAK